MRRAPPERTSSSPSWWTGICRQTPASKRLKMSYIGPAKLQPTPWKQLSFKTLMLLSVRPSEIFTGRISAGQGTLSPLARMQPAARWKKLTIPCLWPGVFHALPGVFLRLKKQKWHRGIGQSGLNGHSQPSPYQNNNGSSII